MPQLPILSPVGGLQPPMPPGTAIDDAPPAAASTSWLSRIVVRLIAAHRRRQEATVARIARSGLAAMD